jgi:uncharacterized ferritin-like protein (DUF455 family)
MSVEQPLDPIAHWHSLIERHFKGALKPPFNDSARNAAGLTTDFYNSIAAA